MAPALSIVAIVSTTSDLTGRIPGNTGFRMTRTNVTTSPEAGFLTEFVSYFGVYVTAVVLVSGIFGNILSIVVFYRLRKRDIVVATYLGPLAMSDLINLCVGVNGWMDNGILAFTDGAVFVEESLSDGHCKFRTFLYILCGSFSTYILMTFSIERCVAVWNPLKVTSVFTQGRRKVAICVVCILSVLLAVAAVPTFKRTGGYGDIPSECRPETSGLLEFVLFSISIYVFYFYLPILSLFTINVLIICGLQRAGGSLNPIESRDRLKQNERKLIKNLLLVSITFIVAMSPLAVCGGLQAIGEITHWRGVQPGTISLIYEVTDFAYTFHYINYSANYIIYVVSLDFYRAECFEVFRCRKH